MRGWISSLVATLALCACDRTTSPAPAAALVDTNVPSAPAAPRVPGSAPALSASAAPVKPAVAPDPLTTLLSRLHPASGRHTLLLGLHVEDPESYAALFTSVGAPISTPGPGYKTVVITFDQGTAAVLGELPYLSVPGRHGFLYLGEATVHEDLSGHESDAEQERIRSGDAMPKWYLATELWKTRDSSEIPKLTRQVERRLRRAKAWGTQHTEAIAYVTPRALCRSEDVVEWTGGAHAFDGTNRMRMEGLDGPVTQTVLARNGRAALEVFAKRVFEEWPPGDDQVLDLTKPIDLGWGTMTTFTTDARTCLMRSEGRVYEAGIVVVPGNSARSFTAIFPVAEARSDIAPSNHAPLAFDVVKAKWSDAEDVLVSPNDEAFVVLRRDEFTFYDVPGRKVQMALPRGPSTSIVMAEWAGGEAAERWAALVDATPTAASAP